MTDDTDDEIAETHRQAAALVAGLLIAETDEEHETALRQAAQMQTYTTLVVVGSLAGIVHDLLDGLHGADRAERLEWIATRIDVIANHRTHP